jgi:hypothetical protein
VVTIVADAESDEAVKQVSADGRREVVTDKGYHSREVVRELTEWRVCTYCSEPNRRAAAMERENPGNNRRCMQIVGALARARCLSGYC